MGLIIWFVDACIILILLTVGLRILEALFSNKTTGIITAIILGYLVLRFAYMVMT